MKPQPKNRKICLRFMDCSVMIEGNKGIEKKALRILSALVQDRIKIQELINEIDHDDTDDSELKHVKPKIKITEYLMGYA